MRAWKNYFQNEIFQISREKNEEEEGILGSKYAAD